MTLRAIFEASLVNRWHCNACAALRNSGDTTGAHSGRVARLVMRLWPDQAFLVFAALVHDDGEGGPGGIGDLDGLGKRGLDPDLRHALERVERAARAALWGDDALSFLDERDAQRLKFVDLLDAFMWAQHHAPEAVKSPEWQIDKASLRVQAHDLGVWELVADILAEDGE